MLESQEPAAEPAIRVRAVAPERGAQALADVDYETQVFDPQVLGLGTRAPEPPTAEPPTLEPEALEVQGLDRQALEPVGLAPRGAAGTGGNEPGDPFFVADELAAVPAPPSDLSAEAVAAASGVTPEPEGEAADDFALADVPASGPEEASLAFGTALAVEAAAEPAVVAAEAAFDADLAAPRGAPMAAAPPVVADDDMWAISAEPEPAVPAAAVESPAPDSGADEFFLAAPEAEAPVLEAPSLILAPPEPTAPSWPAPTPPPPIPAPAATPRQVPLPASPAHPAASPAPVAAAPSATAAAPTAPAAAARAAAPRSAHAPAHPQQPAAASMPVEMTDSELAAPAAKHAAARKPAPRSASSRGKGTPRWMIGAIAGGGGLLLVVIGVAAWLLLAGRVTVEAISPQPVRAGQRATLRGSGFASTPSENVVTFEGHPARVLAATATSLEVEVPPAAVETGTQRRMNVIVRKGTRDSLPLAVDVLQAPRLHGLSPVAALPGEPVLLAGAGWGPGARVRFGNMEAQVVEVDATRIRALVPAMDLPLGSSAPVIVTVAGVDSNTAPFVIGHLPLITGVTPAEAAPGDTVQVNGLGFDANAQANNLSIAGVPALVVAAAADSLKAVVPRLPAGEPQRPVELRLGGSTNVGSGTLLVASPTDAMELRFVAEPFGAAPGRPHAVIATRLGPTFVLAAAGGRSAAERALEAAGRLNTAVPQLQADARLSFEARGYEAAPTIGLNGRPDTLLEVTEEDAAAYNEDWTGLKGRGGPVTRARLARWWEAVGRDLVLLTLRNERPRFSAALAAEGRILAQLYDGARRSGKPGALWQLVEAPKSAQRDGLRLIGLRVPASVAAPAGAPAPPAEPTPPPPPQLKLEGSFRGRETEDNQIRYVIVGFGRGGGNVTYEGGITFSVPLLSLEQPTRDQVRYSLRMRGGLRYYSGRWDGETISGNISSDAAGREVVGTFELRR